MMRVTQRRAMNDTRFSQSFAELSQRKSKLMASTGFSNGFGVSYHTGTKLPQLSRSFSFSTNNKNTKLRLTNMDSTLALLTSSLHDLRLDTRESRRFVNFLKDDLADRQLTENKNNLMLKINKLDKMFKISKKNDEDRSQALKSDCMKLLQSTNSLKNIVSLLNEKIDRAENTMGMYSGKQKHKF